MGPITNIQIGQQRFNNVNPYQSFSHSKSATGQLDAGFNQQQSYNTLVSHKPEASLATQQAQIEFYRPSASIGRREEITSMQSLELSKSPAQDTPHRFISLTNQPLGSSASGSNLHD